MVESYGSVEIVPNQQHNEQHNDDYHHHEQTSSRSHKTKRVGAFMVLFFLSLFTLRQRTFPYLNHEQASLVVTSLRAKEEDSNMLPRFFENTLQWRRVEKDDGTIDHYIGFLEFCSDGKKKFFYRAVSNTSDASTPCIIDEQSSNISPLIRMYPQTQYHLVLINRSHQPTNLHTHGLHVKGVGTVDDITRNVDPGNCLMYHYRIRDDSDVGTFWYHSHRHPLAANQVAGGAHGLLIVDELSLKKYPPHLERFFKNEVLLQYSSILEKSKSSQTRTNLINGKQEAMELVLRSNQYYYFRVSAVVISDPISYMEVLPKEACEVRPMAYDGVYRSELPHPKPSHKHMLTSSSRVDLSVICQNDADIIFHQGSKNEGSNLVNLKVVDDMTDMHESSPFWDHERKTFWNPKRPYYMPNFLDFNTTFWQFDKWNVTMDEALKDENGTTIKEISINQIRWDPDISIREFQLNQLVEWSLINTAAHPFHIHINRMQIVQEGGCGERYEVGEYYDTIASKDPCTIRMQFWDFAGRIVAHCHKLKHEDRGMMVWVDVVGGSDHGVRGTPEVQCSSII